MFLKSGKKNYYVDISHAVEPCYDVITGFVKLSTLYYSLPSNMVEHYMGPYIAVHHSRGCIITRVSYNEVLLINK